MTQLLSTLEYVFAIVTLLGGVIAVHEFGHYLFAKICGARVDVFSIGFGPKLFSKKWGETEYCLSLIPLGGFVKIYGQDPDELADDENPQPDRSLANKSLPARLSVFIGGPAFNYLLAIFIFSLMALVGVQKLPAFATRVVAHSEAYRAGLRSGDKIETIEGKKVNTFEEVVQIIASNPDKTLGLSILRNEKAIELKVPVQKEVAFTPYGEPAMAGILEGLEPLGREAIIANAVNSPWGLKGGDKILSIQDTTVRSWEELEAYFHSNLKTLPKVLSLKVLRDGKEVVITTPDLSFFKNQVAAKNWDGYSLMEAIGLYNPELFVQATMPSSPAEKSGLKKGDRVISVNGKRAYSFENLRSMIQQTGEKIHERDRNASLDDALVLGIERDGKAMELRSSLLATKGKDPLGQTIMSYTIGIQSQGVPAFPSKMILERTLNPAKAVWLGTKETVQHTVMTVVGLKKLVMGEVSMKAVGGPIMIGKIAGDTFSSRGWRDFLKIMAIISISLGVFNLLPVPILDGGHVMFAIIESIRGKPVSQAITQMSLKVGLSLLLLLMIFAVYNDLTKVLPF